MQWRLTTSGKFTIDSIYNVIRTRSMRVGWHRMIWTGIAPQKCKFILWLLVHDRLKTKAFLNRRGMEVDPECLLCAADNEDCKHLFFACEFSKKVWKELLRSILHICRDPKAWNVESAWLRVKCGGRSRSSRKLKLLLACTVYGLWAERNDRVFHKGYKTVEEVAGNIKARVNLLVNRC